jgi:hypothetical protein
MQKSILAAALVLVAMTLLLRLTGGSSLAAGHTISPDFYGTGYFTIGSLSSGEFLGSIFTLLALTAFIHLYRRATHREN